MKCSFLSDKAGCPCLLRASFFFGARIWLGTISGRFSINYFSARLGLRVWVSVGVGVRVSVVIIDMVRVSLGLGSELRLGLGLGYGCKYVWGYVYG